MKRLPGIASAVAATAASVILIGVAVNGFTPSEKQTIQQLRQRISTLEAADAAQTANIAFLQDAVDGLTADIVLLNENDQTVQRSLETLDEGLAGLVAEDGPLAQIDSNLAELQTYVWDRVPAVALTDILPIVTCTTTVCTVDVEWNSEPAASGQVEWGADETYGNLTTKQVAPLAYHKQRLGSFPADGATYHFRVIAELSDASATSGDIAVVAQAIE